MLSELREICSANIENLGHFLEVWRSIPAELLLSVSMRLTPPELSGVVTSIVDVGFALLGSTGVYGEAAALLGDFIFDAITDAVHEGGRETQVETLQALLSRPQEEDPGQRGLLAKAFLTCWHYRDWLESIQDARSWHILRYFRVPVRLPNVDEARLRRTIAYQFLGRIAEARATPVGEFPFVPVMPPWIPGAFVEFEFVAASGFAQSVVDQLLLEAEKAGELVTRHEQLERPSVSSLGAALLMGWLERNGMVPAAGEGLETYNQASVVAVIEDADRFNSYASGELPIRLPGSGAFPDFRVRVDWQWSRNRAIPVDIRVTEVWNQRTAQQIYISEVRQMMRRTRGW